MPLLFLSTFSVSFAGIFSPHFDHYLIFLAPSANIRYRTSASRYNVYFLHAINSLFACTRAQVPVIQLLLGQTGLVSGDQMLSIWRYVVVGAVVAAAVLTPSTDPLTQMLLAGPLLGLYLGGAWMVKATGR